MLSPMLSPTRRALLVGINAYPDSALRGCVNDVQDMAEFLVDKCDFEEADVRLLVDARASTRGILDRLDWLTSGARPGDRLFFHYSGHGAQVTDRDALGSVQRPEDVLCPQNFDWTPGHMISGRQLNHIFCALPKGVTTTVVVDACHSGDIDRDLPKPGRRERRIVPPADLAWRRRAAKKRGHRAVPLAGDLSLPEPPVAIVTGCRSDQTSADAVFGDRPNGALTYYLLRQLGAAGGLTDPLPALVARVVAALGENDYDQVPQLVGGDTHRAFLP